MKKLRKWYPGLAVGVVIIIFDFGFRVLSSSSTELAQNDQVEAFTFQEPSYVAISDEQFSSSFKMLLEARERQLALEQKQRNQKNAKPDGKQGNNRNAKKDTKQKVTNERLQVRTDDGLLTLKGIFFAGEYFAVLEVASDSDGTIRTEQVKAQQMIKNYQVESIEPTVLVLINKDSGETHQLRLFKQD